MDKDSIALLKFAIAVIIIAALLVVWFATVGAPSSDEEDAIIIVNSVLDTIATKSASIVPVF
ncbi:MAG: hypothetical protein IKQ67_08765 [Candidatus Methanomethylophilaceae archaeon]|nr:hypothetical protein [Candidatus Methanomethylophilaceae archaeon]